MESFRARRATAEGERRQIGGVTGLDPREIRSRHLRGTTWAAAHGNAESRRTT